LGRAPCPGGALFRRHGLRCGSRPASPAPSPRGWVAAFCAGLRMGARGVARGGGLLWWCLTSMGVLASTAGEARRLPRTGASRWTELSSAPTSRLPPRGQRNGPGLKAGAPPCWAPPTAVLALGWLQRSWLLRNRTLLAGDGPSDWGHPLKVGNFRPDNPERWAGPGGACRSTVSPAGRRRPAVGAAVTARRRGKARSRRRPKRPRLGLGRGQSALE